MLTFDKGSLTVDFQMADDKISSFEFSGDEWSEAQQARKSGPPNDDNRGKNFKPLADD